MNGAAADPRALRAELVRVLRGRVVLLGIGNPLRGDDAAGCEIARQVRHMASPALLGSGRVLVLEAEDIPESYSGLVVPAAAPRSTASSSRTTSGSAATTSPL